MSIPVTYEKQVKAIIKNVTDIRKFSVATEVYLRESNAFLKDMMEKAGVEYNTDIENLRLPFHDETLSYAFTQLITEILQYEKSSEFLNFKLAEFDVNTTRQLASVFDKEESHAARIKVINEVAENLEELYEEKQNIIRLTMEIEKTIKQLEIRLSTYFN